MRLDAYLAKNYPEQSRSTWQKIIEDGFVQVNGKTADKKTRASDQDTIDIKKFQKTIAPIDIPIIYEDDNVVVMDKPVGVLTHAKGALSEEFTVADFVASKITDKDFRNSSNRPGIIHRLDRATSGIIIVAKNPETAKLLTNQFADRKAHKTYLAMVKKAPKLESARIDLPIGRNPKRPSEFRVDPKGKPAITDYKVVQLFNDGSALLELKPLTGRTHQLRVHLAHIGSPIIGDPVYGDAESERMMLHAQELEITIPDGQRKTFSTKIPHEFIRNES